MRLTHCITKVMHSKELITSNEIASSVKKNDGLAMTDTLDEIALSVKKNDGLAMTDTLDEIALQ